MEGCTEEIVVQRIQSSDVDELREIVRDWNLDFLQLDSGTFAGEVLQIVGSISHFAEGRFGRRLKQGGSCPPGMKTVAIPLLESTPFSWRGYEVTSNTALVFPESNELFAVSKPGFHVYTISFVEEHLVQTAELLGIEPIEEILRKSEAIECCPEEIAQVRGIAKDISRYAKISAESFDPEQLQELLEIYLAQALILMLNAETKRSRRFSFRPRQRALHRAEEYIREFKNQPVSVRELCQATGVSERTLRYVFLQQYGVPPSQYLKTRRLNGVRRSLRQADPASESVAKIARNWQFTHTGQFAKDYREMFGELPSETLAKRSKARENPSAKPWSAGE